VVSIATWAPFLTPPSAVRAVYDFDEVCDTDDGWAKDAGRRAARAGPDRRLQRRDDRADRALPALRDRAVFVGNPGDVVPSVRRWPARHPHWSSELLVLRLRVRLRPGLLADPTLRAELGYRPGE
jgi:hypothetical protein